MKTGERRSGSSVPLEDTIAPFSIAQKTPKRLMLLPYDLVFTPRPDGNSTSPLKLTIPPRLGRVQPIAKNISLQFGQSFAESDRASRLGWCRMASSSSYGNLSNEVLNKSRTTFRTFLRFLVNTGQN
jgi:hypothetical protein